VLGSKVYTALHYHSKKYPTTEENSRHNEKHIDRYQSKPPAILLVEHRNLPDGDPLPLRLRDDDGDALDVSRSVERLLETSVPEVTQVMRVRAHGFAVP